MCRKLSCYLTAALALALLAGCGPAAAQPGSQTAPPTEQATLEPTPEPTQEPSQEPAAPVQFHWGYVLVPLGAVAAIGGGVGAALFLKKRRENSYETEEDG